MRDVFLLGTERSGSTWLANIFDAHPEVTLYMEPFAPYAGLFPGFPGRFVHTGAHVENLALLVRSGMEDLDRWKYPFFYKPGKPLLWESLDRIVCGTHTRIAGIFGLRPSRKAERYDLLNLNRKEVPRIRRTVKSEHPPFRVTKELRLNFKSYVIHRAFESAKIVVTIRHPGAQICSILRIFDRGGLGELRSDLSSFRCHLAANKRFANYDPILKTNEKTEEIPSLLALWWIVSYDVLIEDLLSEGIEFHLVSHERLSATPIETAGDVFEICGLPLVENVRRYIEWSSQTDSRRASPVDTCRVSAKYSRKTIDSADPAVNAAFRKVLEKVTEGKALCPVLVSYLEENRFL